MDALKIKGEDRSRMPMKTCNFFKFFFLSFVLLFSNQSFAETNKKQNQAYSSDKFKVGKGQLALEKAEFGLDVQNLVEVSADDVPESVSLLDGFPVYKIELNENSDPTLSRQASISSEPSSTSSNIQIVGGGGGTASAPTGLYVQYDQQQSPYLFLSWEQGIKMQYRLRMSINNVIVQTIPPLSSGDPGDFYIGEGAGYGIFPATSGMYSFTLNIFHSGGGYVGSYTSDAIPVTAAPFGAYSPPGPPINFETIKGAHPGSIYNPSSPSASADWTLFWDMNNGLYIGARADVLYYQLRSNIDNGSWSNWENIGWVGFLPAMDLTPNSYNTYNYELMACNELGCSAPISKSYVEIPSSSEETVESPPSVSIATAPSTVPDNVGITTGNFRVNEAGAATYTVLIDVPTGISGVRPEITLSYNSKASNGVLGTGWSISGLSAISRCKQTVENGDGALQAVQLNDEDRFCLNGQYLVLKDSTDTYGANGAEYKTAIDSFVTITSHGSANTGPSSFSIVAKDGSTTTYGDGGNSQIIAPDGETVISWLQSSSQDNLAHNDTEITYCYTNGDATCRTGTSANGLNEVAIETISYSDNTVEFNYESRDDTATHYLLGLEVQRTKRLENITVKNHDDTAISKYKTSYKYDGASGFSQLDALTLCNGDGTNCLQPLTFNWTTSNTSLGGKIYCNKGSCLNDDDIYGFKPIDYNGDGLTDMAYAYRWGSIFHIAFLENEGGKFSNTNIPSDLTLFVHNAEDIDWRVLDANGDGYHDVLVKWENNKNSNGEFLWLLYTNNQNGSFDIEDINLNFTWGTMPSFVKLFDYNADGLVDIITGKDDAYHVKYNEGGSFSHFNEILTTSSTSNYRITDLSQSIGGDFNGDGSAELMVIRTRGTAASINLCDPGRPCNIPKSYWDVLSPGFANLFYYADAVAKSNASQVQVGDINGDGLSDIAYRSHSWWEFKLSTGVSFKEGTRIDDLDPENTQFQQLVDLNNDGQADLLYYDKVDKVFYKRLSLGDDFAAESTIGMSYGSVNIGDVRNAFTIDSDGDSKPNLVYFGDDFFRYSGYRSTNQIANYTPENVIDTITDGFGEEVNITYNSMLSSDVYQKGVDAYLIDDWGQGSPVFDLIGSGFLVSSTTIEEQTVEYKYSHARAQAGGRGSLGFEIIESRYTPDSTEIKTITTYKQEYPFTGVPLSTNKYYDNELFSGASNVVMPAKANGVYPKVDGAFQPYIDEITETNSTVNTDGSISQTSTVVTDNDFDEWGNVTGITVTTTDHTQSDAEYIKTTVNTYGDSDEYKQFSRLTNTTVTHTRTGETAIELVSEFTYYDNNLLLETEVIEPNGDNTQYLQTKYIYDQWGNNTQSIVCSKHFEASCGDSGNSQSATDALSIYRVKNTNFDTDGRYITSVSNNHFTEKTITSRNALGQVTEETDASGIKSVHAYDDFGYQYFSANDTGAYANNIQATSITDAPGISNEIDYQFIRESVTSGAPTRWEYVDSRGRIVAKISQAFAADSYIYQYFRYDSLGRMTGQTIPHAGLVTTYSTATDYDDFNRITSISTPTGETAITYSGSSTSRQFTSTYNGYALDQTDSEIKNSLGELITTTDANSKTTTFYYNATGKLRKVIGVDDVEILTPHDKLGRKQNMTDPNKGYWQYEYNALGELIAQTDAKSQTANFWFDDLGRKVKRVDDSGTALWQYYGTTNKKHLLKSEIQGSYSKAYSYDALGRVSDVSLMLSDDSQMFTQSTTYDQFGRVFQQFDGTGDFHGIRYSYNERGYLAAEWEARTSANEEKEVHSQITAMNVWGKITNRTLANGVTQSFGYDVNTGLLISIGGSRQSQLYTFDGLGNLRVRTNNLQQVTDPYTLNASALSETFEYDDLNRLESTAINDVTSLSLSYTDNGNGNLLTKSDVESGGSYHYGTQPTQCSSTAGPHALTQVGTLRYCYDANGNQTQRYKGSELTRSVTYTSFDKASAINGGGETTAFNYGINRSRYKRVHTDSDNKVTTSFYFGNIELVQSHETGSATPIYNIKRYISDYGLQTHYVTDVIDTQYLLKDHIGSIDVITNSDGEIANMMSFDAFGGRRDALNWSPIAQAQSALTLTNLLNITKRGFTGHEMVDHAGVIHMNGRIYDSQTGRFMQADPFIQAPNNSQSYNRYSYVLNNPLTITDPSGFVSIKQFAGLIVAAIGGWICGAPCAKAGWQIVALGAVAGAVHAQVNGGNVILGAFMGAFTAGAAQAGPLASAFVGGIFSKAQGGKFGHGFISAGLGSQIGGGVGNGWTKVLTAAVVGGTISEITGGKFANGAYSAAFNAIMANAKEAYDNRPLEEGSKEWDAREERHFQMEKQEMMDALASGQDLIAYNDPGWMRNQERLMLDEIGGEGTYIETTSDAAVDAVQYSSYAIPALGGYKVIRAMGPLKQWIRFGPSYSRALGQKMRYSIRWGASPGKNGKYIKQIPSTRMQRFNQWIRDLKIPGSSWRTKDAGHLHIRK